MKDEGSKGWGRAWYRGKLMELLRGRRGPDQGPLGTPPRARPSCSQGPPSLPSWPGGSGSRLPQGVHDASTAFPGRDRSTLRSMRNAAANASL